MEKLSDRLMRLRHQRGMTQKDLAAKIGVSASTYRDWEYGKQIKGEPYVAICRALGLSLQELLVGEQGGDRPLLILIEKLEANVRDLKKTALSMQLKR